ncbi:MAG: hypothetical protein K0Q95_2138 [Bacteroidota bacterium]|jgi:hypothetical protein|nr:hypothetical protein [Bacteroidota bacterium]
MSVKACSKCKRDFECCNENPGCWCEQIKLSLDTLQELKKDFDNCLCPDCLQDYSSSPK